MLILAFFALLVPKDIVAYGRYVRAAFEAQIAMFPNMVNAEILELIKQYEHRTLGWKLSGAGGGGAFHITPLSRLLNSGCKRAQRTIRIKVRGTM